MLVFLLDCLHFNKLLKLYHTECRISSNLLKCKQSSKKTSIMCRKLKLAFTRLATLDMAIVRKEKDNRLSALFYCLSKRIERTYTRFLPCVILTTGSGTRSVTNSKRCREFIFQYFYLLQKQKYSRYFLFLIKHLSFRCILLLL